MSRPVMHAFVDEAGQRSRSAKSSDHFVMSAVLIKDSALPRAAALIAQLRADVGRNPGDTLHWRNVKQHSQKLHVAQTVGGATFLGICSVVVCKRHLGATGLNDDQAYLYTFRYLLERLSWIARDAGPQHELRYTLAHIVRFKLSTLRQYEAALRAAPDCKVAWQVVDPHGGRLEQPEKVEYLQLADAVASATQAAFEPDRFGNTEQRYLREFAPRLYRRGSGANNLTSYGLKLHPWSEDTKAAYPWWTTL